MTTSLDPMVRIPVTRATFYEHEDDGTTGRRAARGQVLTNIGHG